MSDKITENGTHLDTAAETPTIRDFQIDPNGLGDIAESLNLFRGDINLPLPLTSIAGRNGLEASVTILYSSNVSKAVDIWNKEAPTGPLGLGWSMGIDFIALDNQDSIAPNNNQYYLISEGGTNRLHFVSDTPDYMEFELEQYQFWQIRFYPSQERWVITKENGNRYIYGGSTGNMAKDPLQYGIKWGQKNGNWKDGSSLTIGQANFTVAWNLASIETPFGDSIEYYYDNELNQIGGSSGLFYTVASRLKMLKAPFSRSLTFIYGDKTYTNRIKEYEFPNQYTGELDFRAFQDRLDTKYLDRIELRNASDAVSAPEALLNTVKFKYDIINIAENHAGHANFYKRYLTDIVMLGPNGLELPNMSFIYYNTPEAISSGKGQPGALKDIIYPQGGKVTYDFEHAVLPGTSRTMGWNPTGTMRFWHGPDYTVCASYDRINRLEVKVLSWNGNWVEAPQTYDVAKKINLETLKVSIQKDFFALSFISDENNPSLFTVLFHKETGRFGQWIAEENFHSLNISNGDQGIVVTGDEFMMALSSPGVFYVKVWDKRTRTWLDKTNSISVPTNAKYALASNNNYLVLASYKSGSTSLVQYYLNETGDFSQATLAVNTISKMDWLDESTPDTFFAPGNDFFVTTYITGGFDDEIHYKVQIQQWNEKFQSSVVVDDAKQIAVDTDFPFLQSIVSGSVVGNLESLYRFDGLEWNRGALSIPSSNSDVPMLLYGSDAALVVSDSVNQINQYDPYSLSWKRTLNVASSAIVPTISYDYFSLGRQIYYRDRYGELQLIYTLPQNILGKSLCNRGPYFFAWEDASGNTYVLLLKNGQVADGPIKLGNQRIYTDATAPGTDLVGPRSFITYTGDFLNPSKFTIYQFVNDRIEGPMMSYVVNKLTINNGYPLTWNDVDIRDHTTQYCYDCNHVTISGDGSVTEFAAATALYGSDLPDMGICYPPPEDNKFGRSEFRYHNNSPSIQSGLTLDWGDQGDTVYYYSYLNGMLFDKTDYDDQGNPVQRLINYYKVHTEYAPIGEPDNLLPLIGGYVKTMATESTQYEDPVVLASMRSKKVDEGALMSHVADFLSSRCISTNMLRQKASGQPERWQFYADIGKQTYYPVAIKNGELQASIGVTRTVSYTYASDTGLLIADETDNHTMDGICETFRREVYFAHQVPEYSILKDRHIWSAVAVSIKFHRDDEHMENTPVEFALTTFKSWGDDTKEGLTPWAPQSTWIGTSEAAYNNAKTIPVSFANWDNVTSTVKDWRKMAETTLRSSSGFAIEALDVNGRPTATILGLQDAVRVATFPNSYAKETAYLGFEAYESTEGWSVAKGTIGDFLVRGDAHIGYTSFELPADESQSLKKTVSIQNNKKTYILSCWIKTAETFDSDSEQATWSVQDSEGTEFQSYDIKGTNGIWEHRHYVVQMGNDTNDGSFEEATLILKNRKTSENSTLLIDTILFNPLISDTSVTVYDAVYGDVLGSVTPAGQTAKTGYDAYRREMVQTSNGRTSGITSQFVVRQWLKNAVDFEFPVETPNSVMEVSAMEGGVMVDLIQGETWKKEWSSNALDDWSTSNGVLRYKGDGTILSSITYDPTQNKTDYGVRVSLIQPQDESGVPIAPSKALGMALGPDLEVIWEPGSGWHLRLLDDTESIPSPIPNTSGFGAEWLLMSSKDPISGNTSIFFMVDGLLLYSNLKATGTAVAGPLSLKLAEPDYGFTTITTFENPIQSMTYLDGAGKELQKHSFSGSGLIVQQTVYDAIGREALATKATLIGAAPTYQTDFVESFDSETGVMTGKVAELHPEADGFPYVRNKFKPTAQSLVIEKGLPGKALSISMADGGPNNNTTSVEYGTNQKDRYPGTKWPIGEYFVTKVKDANGQEDITVTTKIGQEIARLRGPLDDGSYETFWFYYDHNQQLVKTIPPKGVSEVINGTGDGDDWATISHYDFIGNVESEQGPNSNTIQYIADSLGQTRFLLTSENDNGGTNDTIIYNKYDTLGRLIEHGFFKGAWNREELTNIALTDPNYPENPVAYTILNTYTYDGHGSDALEFGQLIEAKTYDENGLQVEEHFEYDIHGNLTQKTTKAHNYNADDFWRLSYEYDNLGQVIKIRYPEGSGLPVVSYLYDKLSQVYAIGNGGDQKDAIGTFTYNAEGSIIESTLNLEDSMAIIRQSQYNAPGWPTATKNELKDALIFSESLRYMDGGYNGAGYFDGKVAQVSYTDKNNSSYAYRFKYDELSRILIAENTANRALSLGVKAPLTYDENGNILSLSRGDKTSHYAYKEKTDQVTTINTGGTPSAHFDYDKDGNTTEADTDADLSNITYQVSGKKVTSITIGPDSQTGTPNSKLSIDYGSSGDRTVKRLTDTDSSRELSAKLYIRGENTNSLFEQEREGDTPNNSQYIYGPDGLMGMVSGNERYVVIKDHLGNIRTVVDETGAVVASFDYTPFGITITKDGSKNPDIIFYRYTGQEFDKETGLYNFPARMYDPESGRFYTIDPKQVGGSPYAYVLNNPVNLVDPDGEEPFTAFLIAVGAAIGAVAGAVTYAVTHRGSFNVGEFFAYTVVGAVSGALAGAALYGVGTGLMGAAGLTASTTTYKSGIAIGAIAGAASGFIDSASMQIGVNLIEGNPGFQEFGDATALGAASGFAVGAILGGFGASIGGRLSNRSLPPRQYPPRTIELAEFPAANRVDGGSISLTPKPRDIPSRYAANETVFGPPPNITADIPRFRSFPNANAAGVGNLSESPSLSLRPSPPSPPFTFNLSRSVNISTSSFRAYSISSSGSSVVTVRFNPAPSRYVARRGSSFRDLMNRI